jgi:hypothetical protein
MAGEGCLLKMPFSTTADSYLQVAVDTCDAKLVRPFVSITCVGPLCASLAKPCDSQSQCGGLNCASIDGFLDNRLSEYSADLRSGAESLKLFNPEKDDAACLTSVTGTKGLGLFSSFGGFFRKYYDDVGPSVPISCFVHTLGHVCTVEHLFFIHKVILVEKKVSRQIKRQKSIGVFTQGYPGIHRSTQGYTGVHRGTQGFTGVHGTQGYTGVIE